MHSIIRTVLTIVFAAFCAVPGVFADDWVAVKLRGAVMQHVDGSWVQLKRGDVVPDDRVVQTLEHARVTFKRDKETIELAPETRIQIVDRSGQRYTTVKQAFGSVTIEAEVRNVQHFEVQTPHLAAVVKGTKFVVTSGDTGGSVKVTRGRVAVADEHNGQSVLIVAGQSVATEIGRAMAVTGRGKLPAVLGRDGKPVIGEASLQNPKGSGGGTGGLGNTVSSAGNTVGNVVSSAGNTVGNAVSGAGSAVGDAVGGPVGDVVSGATGAVGGTVSGVTGLLGGLL